MTEGRVCQIHLLDGRKLELLVQVQLHTFGSFSGEMVWLTGSLTLSHMPICFPSFVFCFPFILPRTPAAEAVVSGAAGSGGVSLHPEGEGILRLVLHRRHVSPFHLICRAFEFSLIRNWKEEGG